MPPSGNAARIIGPNELDFGTALNNAVWRAWNREWPEEPEAFTPVPATAANLARVQETVTRALKEMQQAAGRARDAVFATVSAALSTAGTLSLTVDPSDEWHEDVEDRADDGVVWAAWNAGYENAARALRETAARAQPRSRDHVRPLDDPQRKAEALLQQHLTQEQKDDLARSGHFHVAVRGGKYRITRGYGVKLLDKDGKTKLSFCIHPVASVPQADTMLAQKLLLESDIEEFYRIANVTEYGGPSGSRYFASPSGLSLIQEVEGPQLERVAA